MLMLRMCWTECCSHLVSPPTLYLGSSGTSSLSEDQLSLVKFSVGFFDLSWHVNASDYIVTPPFHIISNSLFVYDPVI